MLTFSVFRISTVKTFDGSSPRTKQLRKSLDIVGKTISRAVFKVELPNSGFFAPVACHKVSRRIGFRSSHHHHHHLPLLFLLQCGTAAASPSPLLRDVGWSFSAGWGLHTKVGPVKWEAQQGE